MMKKGAILGFGALALCAAVDAAAASSAASRMERQYGGKPVEDARLAGTVTVLQEDDFARGRFERQYWLETDDGTRHRLSSASVSRLPQGLESGDRVLVQAAREASGALAVHRLEPLAGPMEARLASVAGDRSIAVMIVDFPQSAVSCSTGTVRDVLFEGVESVASLYDESSFGALGFEEDLDNDGQSDVFRVTINADHAGCDATEWANLADSAATSQGVDPGQYQHRLYVLPGNVGCGWAGLASLGCSGSCRSWVATCSLPDVYAHELGHNLGLRHASTDQDDNGSVDCEYCDRSDFMGIGGVGWRQLNGPHKHEMGWLAGDAVVSASGATATYVLNSTALDPAQAVFPQLLIIDRPSIGRPLFVSYRTRTGYDTGLISSYVDRANIHSRVSATGNTLFIDALDDGETYTDASGITVTQVSHDDETMTVLVGNGSCSSEEPSVTLAPDSQSGSAGTQLSYTVTLTNHDDFSCSSSTFEFTPDVPAGWQSTISPPSLALAPGGQGSATFLVTSSATAAPGDWQIGIDVSSQGTSDHDAADSAGYTVVDAPPTAVSEISARSSGGRMIVLWEPVGPDAVLYRIYRNGQLIGVTDRSMFLDGNVRGGKSYSYEVRSVNANGTEAPSSVGVMVPVPLGRRSHP